LTVQVTCQGFESIVDHVLKFSKFMSQMHPRFRPPLAKPAGDVLAKRAVEVLKSF
jgi:hypothetical protein